MNRRSILGAAAAWGAPRVLGSASRPDKLRRVGMNTILFRMCFPATRVEGHGVVEPRLTLFDIPRYYADRFQLHNLEFWSRHFEAHSPGYLSDLKNAISKTRSRLINIQLDDLPRIDPARPGYFLASENESIRRKSLEFVREWIAAAALAGSDAIRVNTESGSFDLCVRSFRELTEYAARKGVVLLVENHGGISANPDLHVRLIQAVNHRNIRTLPDFGNHRPEIRYQALQAIMPYAYQVSPKALPFNQQGEHDGYDFGRAMRIAVDSGFSGIYSADYWDREGRPVNYEKIADWLIEHILEFL